MVHTIEGTGGELAALLQSEPYVSERLRITIEDNTEEDDLIANLPDPPFAVRTQEELIEKLLATIDSPKHIVTETTWEGLYERIRKRHQANPK